MERRSPEFVLNELESKAGEHATFLRRIPAIQDLQCAWLLPALTCPTLSPPSTTTRSGNVSALWWVWTPRQCNGLRETASLPLAADGLGLRSAVNLRHAAHWASWADSMKMITERHPEVARIILRAISNGSEVDSIQAILSSAASVQDAGFVPPSWEDLASGAAEEVEDRDGEVEPNQPRKGWQSRAARAVESRCLNATREALPIPPQAFLRSQGGPLASTPFLSLRAFRIDCQPFRIVLLRRLRMPLPVTAHSCQYGRLLDSLGHHRSACPVAGVLGTRGFPLENAAARICREAGGRVRTNVMVQDLDLHAINNLDSRRLEVAVDGLSLFRGAQLAIDTTSVSPLSRNGTARPRCATVSGAALDRARIRKERRYPVLAGEIGGRVSSETAQFLRCLASDRVRSAPLILKGRIHAALIRRWSAMLGCSAARSYALSLLDKVPAGVDGPSPSANEVLRDDRHAG